MTEEVKVPKGANQRFKPHDPTVGRLTPQPKGWRTTKEIERTFEVSMPALADLIEVLQESPTVGGLDRSVVDVARRIAAVLVQRKPKPGETIEVPLGIATDVRNAKTVCAHGRPREV